MHLDRSSPLSDVDRADHPGRHPGDVGPLGHVLGDHGPCADDRAVAAAYAVDFPATRERFDRLEEQLEIVTGLWGTPLGERYTFAGDHYTVTDSPALPKPVQDRVPVIVGGPGKKRTPALAARFATEFDCAFASDEGVAAQFGRVRAACESAGRDPRELTYSAALVAVVGGDEAEFARRAAAIGRDPEELRASGVAGTAAEAVDVLHRYADAGVERVYRQILDLTDLDHLDLVAADVLPHLR